MRAMFLAAFGAVAAGQVAAEANYTTVFAHKNWEVELWQYDDGSRACLAEVDAGADSFTIWVYEDASFRLQIYSQEWSFGDPGQTADLRIQIDRRSPWELTGARLVNSSVLFDLPADDSGVRFLGEVAQGNNLGLYTASGEGVKSYSLAGSRASMTAMLDCGDSITGNSSNPFN